MSVMADDSDSVTSNVVVLRQGRGAHAPNPGIDNRHFGQDDFLTNTISKHWNVSEVPLFPDWHANEEDHLDVCSRVSSARPNAEFRYSNDHRGDATPSLAPSIAYDPGLDNDSSVVNDTLLPVRDSARINRYSIKRLYKPRVNKLVFPQDGKPWQPSFLKRWVLFSFVVFYVICMIVLGILYTISQRNQGLGTSTWDKHYFWTYGPTAILTIVMVLWHQVDYRIKQLQPWKVMAETPTKAENGVLLDYISPMLPLALVRAITKRHYPVALSVLVYLLLKLLIIFSTSLLVLQVTDIRSDSFPLTATARFDGTAYNATTVSATPAIYMAATSPQLNSTFPAWTKKDSVIPSFEPSLNSSLPAGSIITAQVDAFVADLVSCETGTVSWSLVNNTSAAGEYTTPSCSAYAIMPWDLLATPQTQFGGQVVQCQDNSTTIAASGDQKRLLLWVAAIGTEDMTPLQEMWVICDPIYSLQPSSVRFDGAALNTTWIVNTTNVPSTQKIDGVSNTDVANGVLRSLDAFDKWFYLENLLIPENKTFTYSNLGVFQNIVTYMYRSTAAQLAKQYLMTTTSTAFSGTANLVEQRVTVRLLSLALMEGTLGLLIFLTLILILVMPLNILPCDPGSIAGLSTILVASQDLMKPLTDHGISSDRIIRRQLSQFVYKTSIVTRSNKPCFLIKCVDPPTSWEILKRRTPLLANSDWWRPFAFTWFMIGFTLTAPLLLIAGMEAVLETSTRTSGIANVESGGLIRYIWVLLPAFIMILLDMVFGSLNFAVCVTQPYLDLRTGDATADRTILANHLKKTAASSLWTAFTRRQMAMAAISLAVLVTPLLTIAVSGLFAGEDQVVRLPISVEILDEFNSSFQSWAPESDSANIAATLLQRDHSLGYPQWTYDTLVFPKVELDLSEYTGNVSELTAVTLTIPAIRPKMSCRPLSIKVVPSEYPIYINMTSSEIGYRWNYGFLNTSTYWFASTLPTSNNEAFGAFEYPNCFPLDGLFDPTAYVCDPLGPYGAVYYGIGNDSTARVTALLCDWPNLEVVQTEVTFTLPGYTINPSNPPVPDESTAQTFSNQSFLPDLFGYIDGGVVISPLMNAAIFGRQGGGSIEALLDPTALASAVEYSYGLMVAQDLNQLLRIPPLSRTSLVGIYTNPFRTRLVQSPIATRILEAFLAVLFICALITYGSIARRVRYLLPKEPCSIAAVASFLSGSEMLSRRVIPEGAEWAGANSLAQEGVFDGKGQTYSLGWWDWERSRHAWTPLNDEQNGYEMDERMKGWSSTKLSMVQGERFGIDVGKARWQTRPRQESQEP